MRCDRCKEKNRYKGLIICLDCYNLPNKCCGSSGGWRVKTLPDGKKVCNICATCNGCSQSGVFAKYGDWEWKKDQYPLCEKCK